MNKKLLLVLISSLLLIAFIWIATLISSSNTAVQGQQKLISELREPPSGGNFTVNSVTGPVSLADFKGKAVVVYFGYTLCPDICPTSLGFLSSALNQLEEHELKNIQGIFVSVDPDRDTLEHLENYAKYFHKNFIGTTATKDIIDDIINRYGASYRMVKTESSLGYLVDHSAAIYFIDKNGQLTESLPHGTLPDKMVATLKGLIK